MGLLCGSPNKDILSVLLHIGQRTKYVLPFWKIRIYYGIVTFLINFIRLWMHAFFSFLPVLIYLVLLWKELRAAQHRLLLFFCGGIYSLLKCSSHPFIDLCSCKEVVFCLFLLAVAVIFFIFVLNNCFSSRMSYAAITDKKGG